MVQLQPWCTYNRGALTTVVHLQLWCTNYHGALTTMVHLQPWCTCNRGALTTVVHLQPWYTYSHGALTTVVHLQPCLPCCILLAITSSSRKSFFRFKEKPMRSAAAQYCYFQIISSFSHPIFSSRWSL